jgi:hypothetical protein
LRDVRTASKAGAEWPREVAHEEVYEARIVCGIQLLCSESSRLRGKRRARLDMDRIERDERDMVGAGTGTGGAALAMYVRARCMIPQLGGESRAQGMGNSGEVSNM